MSANPELTKPPQEGWPKLQEDVRQWKPQYRPHRVDLEQLFGNMLGERLGMLARSAMERGLEPLGKRLAGEAQVAFDPYWHRAMGLIKS